MEAGVSLTPVVLFLCFTFSQLQPNYCRSILSAQFTRRVNATGAGASSAEKISGDARQISKDGHPDTFGKQDLSLLEAARFERNTSGAAAGASSVFLFPDRRNEGRDGYQPTTRPKTYDKNAFLRNGNARTLKTNGETLPSANLLTPNTVRTDTKDYSLALNDTGEETRNSVESVSSTPYGVPIFQSLRRKTILANSTTQDSDTSNRHRTSRRKLDIPPTTPNITNVSQQTSVAEVSAVADTGRKLKDVGLQQASSNSNVSSSANKTDRPELNVTAPWKPLDIDNNVVSLVFNGKSKTVVGQPKTGKIVDVNVSVNSLVVNEKGKTEARRPTERRGNNKTGRTDARSGTIPAGDSVRDSDHSSRSVPKFTMTTTPAPIPARPRAETKEPVPPRTPDRGGAEGNVMGGAVHRTRRFLRGYDEIADDSSDVKQLVGDFLGVDHAPARTSRSKATLGADELKYLKMDLNRIAEEGSKARERGNQSSDAKTAGSSHNATTSTKDKDGDGERGHNRRSATAHVKKRDFKSLAKGPSAPNDRYGKVIKSEGGDEAPADTSDDLAMDFSFHTQGDEGLINSIIENNRIHTDELFMDSKVPKDFRYRRSSDDDDADKSELILNMDSLLDGTHAKNLDNEDILQHLLGKTTKERDSGKVNKDGSNMDYNDDLFKDGLDDEFKSKAKSVLEDPDKVVSKDGDEEEEDDDDDDDYEEEEDDDELPLDPNGGKPPKDSNPNNPYPKIIGFRGDGTNRLSLGLGGVKLPITHHAEDFMSKKFDNTIASVDEPQ